MGTCALYLSVSLSHALGLRAPSLITLSWILYAYYARTWLGLWFLALSASQMSKMSVPVASPRLASRRVASCVLAIVVDRRSTRRRVISALCRRRRLRRRVTCVFSAFQCCMLMSPPPLSLYPSSPITCSHSNRWLHRASITTHARPAQGSPCCCLCQRSVVVDAPLLSTRTL